MAGSQQLGDFVVTELPVRVAVHAYVHNFQSILSQQRNFKVGRENRRGYGDLVAGAGQVVDAEALEDVRHGGGTAFRSKH